MTSLDDLLGATSTAGLTGQIGTDFGTVSADDLFRERPEVPDPLASVEYTGDLAEDTGRELSALETAYRDRAKAEANRFRDATDSEFWFAVCFKTRAEKEAFLTKFGLIEHGDKYLDGAVVANILNQRN